MLVWIIICARWSYHSFIARNWLILQISLGRWQVLREVIIVFVRSFGVKLVLIVYE